MDLGLAGKRGIVVGGSRGIGKAIALELAREGVDLAISARTEDELARTAREIAAATGQRVLPMPLDVKDRDRVDTVIDDAARKLGGLHILINSGSRPGGSPTATGRIDTIVDEDFLDDFDTSSIWAPCAAPVRRSLTSRPLAGAGSSTSAASTRVTPAT